MISYQAARMILMDDPNVPSMVKTIVEALDWREPLHSLMCAELVLEICKKRVEQEILDDRL